MTKSIIQLKYLLCLMLMASAVQAQEEKYNKPSPDSALEMLKSGNERFYSERSVHPNADKARLALAGSENQAKFAYATILSCSDSRVPVEMIFDAGIMDLFIVRVAGNVCDTDEIGSIEYGLAHVSTPVLVILGHTKCGAVTAVVHMSEGEGHKLERNIPGLVDNIKPAVIKAFEEHKDIHGDQIIPYATEENIWQSAFDLFRRSPAVRMMVREKKVKVIGAVYDIETGKVNWLPEERILAVLQKAENSPEKEKHIYHE